ncbi:carboxymuconolactone decarboxylase family protein [Nonomuraea polychroma]|uniref:carboxymuconolactone decarboxylase family protein n=1 Tax=Nonomuraea polychroma TaxID=46176 RepID=UPI003D8DEECE
MAVTVTAEPDVELLPALTSVAIQAHADAEPSFARQRSDLIRRALDNGPTTDELAEAITHLSFYAGSPNAMTAITQLKNIVESEG